MSNIQRSTIVALNTLMSGQKTSTAAAAAVAIGSHPVRSVLVRALAGNAGLVYVGPSGITSSTGYELSPGEPVAIDVDDLGKVFLKVANDSDGVCYLGVLNQ